MDKINQLMNDVYTVLMTNHIEAFDKGGSFNFSRFEDSSGLLKGELLFMLLLTHFEEREEYEKCNHVIGLREKFRIKFGTNELIELKED